MIKPVCNGECLFGKCPFDKCMKFLQEQKEPQKISAFMNIQTGFGKLDIEPDSTGFGIAMDIGTTTIAAALFNLNDTTPRGIKSCINSQVSFGLDVISRIKYATDIKDGLGLLNRAVVNDLNGLITAFCSDNAVELNKISKIVISGNTAMLHILCNIDISSMGVSPFTPKSLFGVYYSGLQLGLVSKNTDVYITDCMGAFVGGDITSAVLASGMHEKYNTSILIDIGTNGEIVLGGKQESFAASTAAGPAFEGASITCGMAGVNGAINSIDVINSKIRYTTIGGGLPKGICGSGVIDALSLMKNLGVIDETGAFSHGNSKFDIADGIYINIKDVREVQTAKAAICAGILTLIDYAGKKTSDIKNVYLSGGLGNFLNPDCAVNIGLLPKELRDKIIPIGNGALAGAAKMLLSKKYLEMSAKIAEKSKCVELATSAYFAEKYIDCMSF